MADPIRAAEYLRMSTDDQVYSIENQRSAIASYAGERGFEVVCSYVDAGRSGLTLTGRPGLQALLADALGPTPDFQAILVFDVSRWGRFQDVDQGAHYEFLCRRAGMAVEYCADPFDNDGGLEGVLIKELKRAMAAELSRDMSMKLRLAKHTVARKGYLASGSAVYGLRRHVVDQAGRVHGVLEAGERKVSSRYRVVLAHGPPSEVATVARIFRLYVLTGLRPGGIAALLNGEGVAAVAGRAWSAGCVRRVLRNETYAGVLTFGRRSGPLGERPSPMPRDSWTQAEASFEPLVSRALFVAAQQLMDRYRRLSDEEALGRLARAVSASVRMTGDLIDANPDLPCAAVYRNRFGGLRKAYGLIGYSRTRKPGQGPGRWPRPSTPTGP
ncbi:MAG: recombinase family protein [Phenylobacterium sp.]|uniref:recombinase family protein n=1 Tax=Phenylobacterium sp. TaxID=1871053 RepID=UPI003BB6C956